jgi:phenylalanine-4-hydroxylase
MQSNEVLEKLPKHLMSLVIEQPYNNYTAQDQAVWRYIMRQNVRFLNNVAHGSYIGGLRQAGISVDEIPQLYGMNRILKEIGWAAVAVDGFIPPAAFMEFQAYKVLVIAADIRPVGQIEYTPAPDIIHEAAGHAPIIADTRYADYLRVFGEIGSKAFSSAKDYEQYEAIRHLSILKADPYTPQDVIAAAEEGLKIIENEPGEPSEMALIRNLHWWTVEYGLIGDLKHPKIYGAGLLSSIGESSNCMKPEVKKLPYTIDAVNYSFDITTQQPQLFVTPDFEYLKTVLNQFADKMALRRGGLYGINKAIESQNIGTCQFSSGLQVSGTFTEVIGQDDKPVYLKTTGPTQLCYKEKQLKNHGKDNHQEGFGSPVGRFHSSPIPPELMTTRDLEKLGIIVGNVVHLEFESWLTVDGKLNSILKKEDKNLIFTFEDCTVKFHDQVLFQPEWGTFDMAVGQTINSAFSGPADPNAFKLSYPAPKEKTHKILHSREARKLHTLYQEVRDIRTDGHPFKRIPDIWQVLKNDYPNDWLLPLEILELATKHRIRRGLDDEIKTFLLDRQQQNPELTNLINNGLNLIES